MIIWRSKADFVYYDHTLDFGWAELLKELECGLSQAAWFTYAGTQGKMAAR